MGNVVRVGILYGPPKSVNLDGFDAHMVRMWTICMIYMVSSHLQSQPGIQNQLLDVRRFEIKYSEICLPFVVAPNFPDLKMN